VVFAIMIDAIAGIPLTGLTALQLLLGLIILFPSCKASYYLYRIRPTRLCFATALTSLVAVNLHASKGGKVALETTNAVEVCAACPQLLSCLSYVCSKKETRQLQSNYTQTF